MKYRALGRTDLRLSVIGLGTHQFSGEWAKDFSQPEVADILGRAKGLGINFIDTAECYGDHSVEALIGESIRGNRGDWIVATKFGHAYANGSQKIDAWSPEEVSRQLEDSLKALKTDYVDLYQFHSGSDAAFENEALWTMLAKQAKAGKIRFLGLSLSAAAIKQRQIRQLDGATKSGVDVVQVLYNRLFREAEAVVLPFCERHRLGVLGRVPLAKGFLSGAYKPGSVFAQNDVRSQYSDSFNDEQLRLVQEIREREVPAGQNMAQWALAWCLRQPTVSTVVVGCKNAEQLELNAAAVALLDQPLQQAG